MLCPLATGKSGSNWLDRLRSAKGFTDDGASDLENFLQNPNSQTSETTCKNPNPIRGIDVSIGKDKKFINMMSNVICELFNFGDYNSDSAEVKRSARKQANPKSCVLQNNRSDASDNVDFDKSIYMNGCSNNGVDRVKELNERKDEEDDREENLPGFSRTEVTVIDTSYEPWKFDKLLFRKKKVWKVRDKKGKSETLRLKKKKIGGSAEDRRCQKKQKIGYKEGQNKECEIPLNEVARESGTGKFASYSYQEHIYL